KVSVTPDTAIVEMLVRHRAATPAEAKRVADDAVNALLAVAPSMGIDPDDITASDLELHEAFEYDENNRRIPSGHVATREVKVRFDDLERLGAYMDAALAAGMTEISDIQFKSRNEVALREDARARAVAEAREKAAGLAVAFDAALGPVYSINSLN